MTFPGRLTTTPWAFKDTLHAAHRRSGSRISVPSPSALPRRLCLSGLLNQPGTIQTPRIRRPCRSHLREMTSKEPWITSVTARTRAPSHADRDHASAFGCSESQPPASSLPRSSSLGISKFAPPPTSPRDVHSSRPPRRIEVVVIGSQMPVWPRVPSLPFLTASTAYSVTRLAGLLHPAADPGVHLVSDSSPASSPPSSAAADSGFDPLRFGLRKIVLSATWLVFPQVR